MLVRRTVTRGQASVEILVDDETGVHYCMLDECGKVFTPKAWNSAFCCPAHRKRQHSLQWERVKAKRDRANARRSEYRPPRTEVRGKERMRRVDAWRFERGRARGEPPMTRAAAAAYLIDQALLQLSPAGSEEEKGNNE